MAKDNHNTAEDSDEVQDFKLGVPLLRERPGKDFEVLNHIEATQEFGATCLGLKHGSCKLFILGIVV
jgi:hypothetical protein